MVDPEEVRRVVATLELHEAIELGRAVDSKGLPVRVGVVVPQEVDVLAGHCMGPHRVGEPLDPGDPRRIVGWIGPEAVDVEPELRGTIRERRGVLGDAAERATHVVEVRRSPDPVLRAAVLDERVDHRAIEPVERGVPPVRPDALRHRGIERRLEGEPAGGIEDGDIRRAGGPKPADHRLALGPIGPRPRESQEHQGPVAELPVGRRDHERDQRRDLVGNVGRPLDVRPEGLGPARSLVDERACEDVRVKRVGAEGERGDDPEVAAAAAQAPEQVGVLGSARADMLAGREDHLGGLQVVDRQAVPAGEPPDAAAERQARDPRSGHHAHGHRERVGLGRPIDVAERRPGLDADQAGVGIDLDRVQPPQVQKDAVVHGAVARDVVAAAADRQRQSGLPGERDRRARRRRRSRPGRSGGDACRSCRSRRAEPRRSRRRPASRTRPLIGGPELRDRAGVRRHVGTPRLDHRSPEARVDPPRSVHFGLPYWKRRNPPNRGKHDNHSPATDRPARRAGDIRIGPVRALRRPAVRRSDVAGHDGGGARRRPARGLDRRRERASRSAASATSSSSRTPPSRTSTRSTR